MDHAPGLVLLGLHPPDFLDARFVGVGILALHAKALDQRLRAVSANTFAEHRDLRQDVHAGLKGGLGHAVGADSHVAGADTDHPIAVAEHLLGRESGVDLDAEGLALFGEPLCDVAHRSDVVALLLEHGRRYGDLIVMLRVKA